MRFAGHCWRSKEELAGDVLLWTQMHGRRTQGRPKKTYRPTNGLKKHIIYLESQIFLFFSDKASEKKRNICDFK